MVSLHEVAKFSMEDERVGLLAAKELVFNGKPDATPEASGVMTSLRRSGAMEAYIEERTVQSMASQSASSIGVTPRFT
jgi:hypothetical protein